MTTEKKRVLIVDDNPGDIHVLLENLKPEYAVLVATSGEKALEMAKKEPQPDVILMDVMMPEMDGYETCRRLKDDLETDDIAVIFVSAHDTTEEKLAGYDAGGSDYLIKPVQPEELLKKVSLAMLNKDARLKWQKEKAMAINTAMGAISSAGEQGVVLEFMRRSFTVNTTELLAQKIVEAVGEYNLECSVQIRGTWQIYNASSTVPMPPLEQEILLRMKDMGRIREKGANLVLNFSAITLLIKNMPDDKDTRGRLRDHLALLAEGAEARLQALEMGEELRRVLLESNQALATIQATGKEQNQKAINIMDNVMEQLEKLLLSYGMTEAQENQVLSVIQGGIERTLDNFEQGLKRDEQLHAIINRLARFS